MQFKTNEHYKITFYDGHDVCFRVPDKAGTFLKTIAVLDSGEKVYLNSLLMEDWEKIEVLPDELQKESATVSSKQLRSAR